MFARENGMKKWVLLAAVGVVAGLMACATSQAPEGAAATGADRLSSLSVTSDGESTLVTFVGVRDADVVVGEHSDPWSLSVELGDVPMANAMSPVAVYDGLVDQVSASSFVDDGGATATRVEIALAREAAHDVEVTEDGVAVRIFASDGEHTAEASEADADESSDVWGEDAAPMDAAFEPASAATPPAASALSDVRVEAVDGGVVVHLVADGAIGEMQTFVLESPDRLVVDLPGLASTVKQGRVQSDSSVVSSVRVGAHADKVRVVMDGGSDAMGFQAKHLAPAPDGLFVSVGEGEALESALAAALAASESKWAASAPTEVAMETESAPASPAAELDEEPGFAIESVRDDESSSATDEPTATQAEVVTVFGVEYESDAANQVERIAIVASGAIDHDWVAPDAETVVIRLPHAVISKEAEGRIAPREGSPLSLISVFQQPDVEPAEVRIVVKRTANLVPTIASMGSNVLVEFPAPAMAPPAAVARATESDELEVAAADELEAVASVDPTEPQMPTSPSVVEDDLPMIEDVAVATPVVAVAEELPLAAVSSASSPPASLEPPAAIEVLQEGGLIDGKQYRGRRISLDFKDVAIADVLRLIAEVSDLNIISGDEVQGNVSIRLVDVPWDQALDVILLTKGLGFVRVGNVLRIAPADVLAQEEEVRLQERRAKEKLEDLVVKLIPVNYGDVKSMQGLVKRLLTSRGSVNLDERTSTLIVKDIASVVDEATALVGAVDTETPQVMIEAKIVEAKLEFSRELGSVWSVGRNQLTDPFDSSSPIDATLGSKDFRWAPSNFRSLSNSNNVSFLNNITATPTGLLNLSAFILDEQFNLDVQLQAAEESGNGKVVSSPRVVTLDNTEAEVEQGVSIPFQTFENGDAKLEFIDAVLSLKVTPHITSNKSIIMKIEVTRDAPDATVPTPTGSPAIAKNQAKTETLVKDGQTLVMGGIYTIDKALRQTRVPYLHRIPIFGTAFKSKEVDDSRQELLIFVTPRIVVQPEMAS